MSGAERLLFDSMAGDTGRRGLFITLEGQDGSGKSSVIAPLSQALRAHGHEVVITREPGGTELAEQLRALLLGSGMDPMTELLLATAARRDHIRGVIAPALQRGAVVLCDRFIDSTVAYQGFGRGLAKDHIRSLHKLCCEDLEPDLTFLFHVSAEEALRRRSHARSPDRFEAEDREFFDRVNEGYASIAMENPHRVALVDSGQSKDQVIAQVIDFLGLDTFEHSQVEGEKVQRDASKQGGL